jgi:two-component system, NtrC family, sensor kinase
MPPLPQGSGPISREWSGTLAGILGTSEEQLRASNALLRVLTEAQADFIRGADIREVCDRLLTVVLELTGSTSGFIGEVRPTSQGAPALQVLASLPRDLMDLPLERSGGFLELPLEAGGERVGRVGLTPPPGAHDAELIAFLQPFLFACGNLLLGWRKEQRRRQAEQELRHIQAESAERLRLVMDNVQDGVWDLDLTTGLLFVNRRWLGMLGYAEGELEPSHDTWLSLCHPEDASEAERLVREHLKGSTPFIENEQRLRRRDGGWMWVLTRAKVVERDEQGRPLRMVGTNVDITARKSGEERLRALVRALPDLVFRNRIDGTYLDFLANGDEPLLTSPESIIGRTIRQMPMLQPLAEKMMLHLERAIRDGTLEVLEYSLEMPKGRQEYEARIFRSGPDEAISLIRNITERKQIEARLRQQEEELRRQRDSLEELVRTRGEKLRQATLELEEQQAQLIQAEKLASLGQMAAGIVHEINNPVSYVMSNLGTLDQYVSALTPLLRLQGELLALPEPEERSPAAELRERLREQWKQEDVDYILTDMPQLIEESLAGTRRVIEIAQSLRSFAREDSGEPQLVDVNAELASTLKMVWNELKYKCEVKRDFGPLPPVSCHPTQLAQVFTNLLVNAAHAIETRGEIRIRTRHEGSEVVVEISDTGKGMTQETLSKLFTPFFTTKPRGQGTGLGLSVSYGIITRHKGRIAVQSEPGKGSTFTIHLPAAQR